MDSPPPQPKLWPIFSPPAETKKRKKPNDPHPSNIITINNNNLSDNAITVVEPPKKIVRENLPIANKNRIVPALLQLPPTIKKTQKQKQEYTLSLFKALYEKNELIQLLSLFDLQHDFCNGGSMGACNYINFHKLPINIYDIATDIDKTDINSILELKSLLDRFSKGTINERSVIDYIEQNILTTLKSEYYYNDKGIYSPLIRFDIGTIPDRLYPELFGNQVRVLQDNPISSIRSKTDNAAKLIKVFFGYDPSSRPPLIADNPQGLIHNVMSSTTNYFNKMFTLQNILDSAGTSTSLGFELNVPEQLKSYTYRYYSITQKTTDRDYRVADINTRLSEEDSNILILTIRLNGLAEDNIIKMNIKLKDRSHKLSGFGKGSLVSQIIKNINDGKDEAFEIKLTYSVSIFLEMIKLFKEKYAANNVPLDVTKRDLKDFIIEWKYLGDSALVEQANRLQTKTGVPTIFYSADQLTFLSARVHNIHTIAGHKTGIRLNEFILYRALDKLEDTRVINKNKDYYLKLMNNIQKLNTIHTYVVYVHKLSSSLVLLYNNIRQNMNANITNQLVKKLCILKFKDSLDDLYRTIMFVNILCEKISEFHTVNKSIITFDHEKRYKLLTETTIRVGTEDKSVVDYLRYLHITFLMEYINLNDDMSILVNIFNDIGIKITQLEEDRIDSRIMINTKIIDSNSNYINNTHINFDTSIFFNLHNLILATSNSFDDDSIMKCYSLIDDILSTFRVYKKDFNLSCIDCTSLTSYAEFEACVLECLETQFSEEGPIRDIQAFTPPARNSAIRGGGKYNSFIKSVDNYIKTLDIVGPAFTITSEEVPIEIEHVKYATDDEIRLSESYINNIARFGPSYEHFFISMLYNAKISLLSVAYSLSDYNLDTNQIMKDLYDKYMADQALNTPSTLPLNVFGKNVFGKNVVGIVPTRPPGGNNEISVGGRRKTRKSKKCSRKTRKSIRKRRRRSG